jgi:hypothetical protein
MLQIGKSNCPGVIDRPLYRDALAAAGTVSQRSRRDCDGNDESKTGADHPKLLVIAIFYRI